MAFSATLSNLGVVPDGPPLSPDDLPPGLREEYLAGMRATLGVLAGIAKRLAAAGSDREALETLRRETHKIHGSAGSFGFMEASRLAAGMEATAKDWIARPGDTDMDRGGLTGWFVTRLGEMLSLTVPAATTGPPRLIIRRPSAAQKALAPPPAPPPLRPPPRPEPPKQPPPKVRPSRPLTPFKKPSVAPAAPAPPPAASPPPAPPAAPPPPRRETPPERAPQPPPSPPPPPPRSPPPPPKRPPKPPPAQPEGIPWLVTPEESIPAKQPQAPAPPRAPASPPPAPPPRSEPTPPPQPAVESPPAAATSAAPELILVEDDPALAELLEYGLRSRGYRFVSYRNGRDALRELLALDVAGTRPLVLLDVDLPGLDGYSVLEGLERDRPGAYRVVFTTVHGGEAEQLRGLEAGALDYLVKPISLRVALEKIRRWVGR